MVLRTLPLALSIGSSAVFAAGPEVDFARDVRPILSENCFHCHGPDAKARKADLRLDEEAGAREAIASGELFHRVSTGDRDEIMPPPKSKLNLSEAQIATIGRWIEEGAKWGRHWAFQPVSRPKTPPAVHPIDFWLETRLKAQNLEPNPRAPRHSLIRRAALDLTGLPPSPKQVDAFVADARLDAWERAIDQFLAAPAFGERMAWDWLDAARYADSNGYQGDMERTMWPWRDWVVRAFNANLPWDRFTVLQLAGDLLPDAGEEEILATGFCRNHMINGEGGRIPEENRIDYVMDMTETMGTVWLGLTLNCARCHDHKFDPLTQRDYYGLFAFFNQTPVTGGGRDPQTKPVLAVATDAEKTREAELASVLSIAQQAQNARAAALRPLQAAWERQFNVKTAWTLLEPRSAAAEHVDLSILEDRSVLAGGANPDKDTYVVAMATSLAEITAIRLDALQHASFTNSGKGLARSDSGNFVLTEFELRVGGKAVKFASAAASFEQGGLEVRKAFDGNATSGWAVHAGKPVDRPHHATFFLDEPLKIAPGADLEFTLRHESPHRQHLIGRFQLSATDSPSPRAETGDAKLLAAVKIDPDKRTKEQVDLVIKAHRESDPEFRDLAAKTDRARKALDSHRKAIPKVMVMADMPEPRQTFMLTRGLYNQPGEEVSAAVPALFEPLPADVEPNRLALAKWLVSPENPLTARVTVNRFWQMLFGVGLVKTVEDFGVQGEIPPNQELLDWLAAEFVESGWDVKHLLRVILTSEAYQRSSQIRDARSIQSDPANRFLARGARFRLPSWMIRDQALAASGLLEAKLGGASFNGYQPPGIWEEATFGKKKYAQSAGDELYRRSLYIFWRRIVGPTMFFDSGKRQICEVKTTRTNTPMHALSTLNDVTYVEAARHLAQRAMLAERDDTARLRFAGKAILAREPAEAELVIWQRGLNRARAELSPEEAEALLKNGDSARDESLPAVEHAALASVCLMLLNLDEALTKE